MRTPMLAALAALLFASAAHAYDLDRCGLVVPAGEVGHLVADLTCPGTLEAGVYLEKGATLSLNGHSLIGAGERYGALCVGSCTILGTGEIGQFKYCVQIAAGNRKKITVRGVEIHDCERGVVAEKLEASRVVAHHHTEYAFSIGTMMRGTEITADDNGLHGFFGPSLELEDSVMRRNGSHAVQAWKQFKGTNVTFEDNVFGGVVAVKVKATNLTATGNDGGVTADRLLLRDSTVIDNTGYDIASAFIPRLEDTVCGHSLKAPKPGGPPVPFGTTWEVCTDD